MVGKSGLAIYKEKVRSLSAAIVDAQRPIRILDAVKWSPSVEAAFFAAKARELPVVGAETYAATPLGYDPAQKAAELRALGADVERSLGSGDALGELMRTICFDYADACEMLGARGTRRFYELSRKLYGSPKDRFVEGSASIRDQGRFLYDVLASLDGKELGREHPKSIPATEAVDVLQARFDRSFLAGKVEVRLSDGIVSDASAGSSEIKLKEGAFFSGKDLDIFEVHEGWVHVATTLNGRAQTTALFLAKGPPRCVSTQEGLATLMEILTFSSYPRRARAINDRIVGIDRAEDGADFLDLYRFYLEEGYGESDAFRNAKRVFRGGVVAGGAPFTKDISYCKGFVETYNFMRAAIRRGRPELIPLLFAGKMNAADVPLLHSVIADGIVDPPALLPPHFADLSGLAVWLSFSNFLNGVDMARVQERYDALFARYV